ncbi:FitA-like ribbon-helix-helix domain-containing protein [Xanthomonas arboricola]|uniref:FitA-like ribbon-helix-helix domain-containing protein n=1 Tax=Xanthomonas arboricola TaxID=56448 RepID=UPI0035A95237
MPSFTVRNIPDGVHRAIRARAALHGRSTEPNEPTFVDYPAVAGISGPGLCPVWYPVLP